MTYPNKSRTTVVVGIANAVRLPNTASGNPRWKLLTQAGVFETKPDAQCNYQPFDAWAQKPRPQVQLTLDGAGKVIGAERIGD